MPANWICCQIGAREHYAIPRALNRRGALELLVTDAWVAPGSVLTNFKANLKERFHHELDKAPVYSANLRTIAFELKQTMARRGGWARIIRRNEWFQKWALGKLERIPDDGAPRVLFAYSYAALKLFRFARSRRWQTVLGQIDPGLHEEKLVHRLHVEAPGLQLGWTPAPAKYWQAWREECALADRLVVNSEWAKQGLLAEGIAPGNIQIIPLAFEPGVTERDRIVQRDYPERFTPTRPLRVLFLGQVNLRKGIIPLLEAMHRMREKPIEFWFAGPAERFLCEQIQQEPKARWIGQVSRSQVSEYYRKADLFILPTFSDGFALTQLEARALRLPIIVSNRCGEVVRDGVNGMVLGEPTADAIVAALHSLLSDPQLLQRFSDQAGSEREFSLAALGQHLAALFP